MNETIERRGRGDATREISAARHDDCIEPADEADRTIWRDDATDCDAAGR